MARCLLYPQKVEFAGFTVEYAKHEASRSIQGCTLSHKDREDGVFLNFCDNDSDNLLKALTWIRVADKSNHDIDEIMRHLWPDAADFIETLCKLMARSVIKKGAMR